jgi:amino acid adenylation domain-containing protein/FkbM family methyltransferase
MASETPEIVEGFRLSPLQRRAWRLQGGGSACRISAAVRISGPWDGAGCGSALARAVSRHEILRTRFATLRGVDVPIQVIDEPGAAAPPAHRRLDLAAGTAAERERRLAEVWDEHQAPFDHAGGPLLRSTLVALAPDEHLLLLTLPSLSADAVSLRHLVREAVLPAGAGDEPPVQYADVAEWHNELLGNAQGEEGRGYWRRLAEQEAPAPEIPFAGTPAAAASFRPRLLAVDLPPEAAAGLERLAADCGVDFSTAVLAGLDVVLWRLTGRQRIAVARLFAGRGVAMLAAAQGPFARFLPVAADIDGGATFRELLRRLDATLRAHDPWQDLFAADPPVPLPVQLEIVEWPPESLPGGIRLSLERCDWCLEPYQLKVTCLRRAAGPPELALGFDPACHPAGGGIVPRLARQLATLLAGAAAAPDAAVGELEVLDAAERREILIDWNRTAVACDEEPCAPRLFSAHAAAAPDAVAVVDTAGQLTFGELERRANRLAHRLRGLGVGLETPVGLCMDRSAAAVVTLLAVWKSGGAYVPLDPALPPARLRFLVADTAAPLVLCEEAFAPLFAPAAPAATASFSPRLLVLGAAAEAGAEAEAMARHSAASLAGGAGGAGGPGAGNLAYVLYTSGSSGRPKGVMVRHGALINLLLALGRTVYEGLPGALAVGLNAPIAFDASVKQLLQLCRGHRLHLVPTAERLDAGRMLSYLGEHALDVLDLTPTQLRLLLDAGLRERPLQGPRRVLVGGEAIDAATWQALAAHPAGAFWNVYGPTECTVDAAACAVAASPQRPTLGRPLANVRIHLLDAALRPVPVGAAAELCIGGRGVSRGYLGQPALTAERFVPDPYGGEAGARLYRSGDLARYLPSGEIDYLGRLDHQVKVRGVRVELGEIEAVLGQHPGVREAVVSLREDEAGGGRLVAYVTPRRRPGAWLDGRPRHVLPNGLAVVEQNRNETVYLYREIFEAQSYLRHGVELPPGALVLDVGANIGLFTLFARAVEPSSRVWAFEPIAPIFESLRLNVSGQGDAVRLFPWGLAEREAPASFVYYPRYSMMSGLASYADAGAEMEVIKRYLDNARSQGAAGAEMLREHVDGLLAGRFDGEVHEGALRRLSDVLREERIERVDLLKIDVQRAELDVLAGLDEADWPKIQQLVMEVHDERGAGGGGPLDRLFELLAAQGLEALSEQEELLAGTDRHLLYAVRPAGRRRLRRDPGPPVTPPAAVTASSPPAAEELRDFLRQRLPEAMVPAAFVVLEALPVGPNGKVDRRALPAPESLRQELRAGFVSPRTAAERTVAEVWEQALRVDKVGIHDNFFDLGGNSLLLVQVHGRLRELFAGADLSLLELFQRPTVSSLAAHLAAGGQDEDAAAAALGAAAQRGRRQTEALAARRRPARERPAGSEPGP